MLDGASVMQLLLYPLVNEGSLVDTTRCCDLSDNGPLFASERNRDAVSGPRKHGLCDLFELVIESRQLVGVPKIGELANGIGIGDLHGFFQRA